MAVKRHSNILYTIDLDEVATITLYEDSIVEVLWLPKKEEVTLEEMQLVKKTIGELSDGELVGVYTITYPFMSSTTEAQKYAASDEGNTFTYANAVLIDNLAKKLLYNFFLSINNSSTPIKAFTNREDAIEWLKQLKPKIKG